LFALDSGVVLLGELEAADWLNAFMARHISNSRICQESPQVIYHDVLNNTIEYVCGYTMKTVQQNYRSFRPRKFKPEASEDPSILFNAPQILGNDNEFNTILLEAVDESLSSLGESAKQAVYFHLETSFRIKKHEISSRIDEFTFAIEDIFEEGAKILEIQIMKRLREKIGPVFEYHSKEDDLSFIDFVRANQTALRVRPAPL
jgi:hypothetical protein